MNSNATNRTQYFGFPLFTADDKPSILTDWNGTVEELDTTLEDISVRLAGVEQTATAFMDTVNSLRTRMDEIVTRISADESIITENSEAITDLYDKLATLDTSVKSILTRLPELATKAELTTAVGTINQQISDISEDVVYLMSKVPSLVQNEDFAKVVFPTWQNQRYYFYDCVKVLDGDKYRYFRCVKNQESVLNPLNDTDHEYWREFIDTTNGNATFDGVIRDLNSNAMTISESLAHNRGDVTGNKGFCKRMGTNTSFTIFHGYDGMGNKSFNEVMETLIADSQTLAGSDFHNNIYSDTTISGLTCKIKQYFNQFNPHAITGFTILSEFDPSTAGISEPKFGVVRFRDRVLVKLYSRAYNEGGSTYEDTLISTCYKLTYCTISELRSNTLKLHFNFNTPVIVPVDYRDDRQQHIIVPEITITNGNTENDKPLILGYTSGNSTVAMNFSQDDFVEFEAVGNNVY